MIQRPATSRIFSVLDEQGYVVLDGGLATELERKGFDLAHPLWSARIALQNPQAIKDVHFSYLKSGADLIITASYQASFPGCRKQRMSDIETERFLKRTVEIAVEAREEFIGEVNAAERELRQAPLIAASVGPYGAYLANGAEYKSDYGVSKEDLYEFHVRRWEILAATESDVMACETIPSFDEALVLRGLIEQTQNKRAYVSFSCKDGEHINDGTPIRDCSEMISDCEDVFAIGINCTSPRFVSSLIKKIKEGAPEKEIIVYPNSGETYVAKTKDWKAVSNQINFSRASIEWFRHGARLIGGCCRTTPKDIRAIRAGLSQYKKRGTKTK